jgi:hypothetical protein
MQGILCLGALWLSRPNSVRLVQASMPLRGYVFVPALALRGMTSRSQFVAQVDTVV